MSAVVGAALFGRTLQSLLAKGPGFETSNLVFFGIDPVRNGYAPADAERLIARVHEIDAVRGRQPLDEGRQQQCHAGEPRQVVGLRPADAGHRH